MLGIMPATLDAAALIDAIIPRTVAAADSHAPKINAPPLRRVELMSISIVIVLPLLTLIISFYAAELNSLLACLCQLNTDDSDKNISL